MFIFDPPPSAIVIPTSIVIGTPVTGGTVFGILWEDAAGTLQSGPALSSAAGDIKIPSAGVLSWNADTILARQAANVLQMANGTTPQELRVQANGTHYLALRTTANRALIGGAGDTSIDTMLMSGNSGQWLINTGGGFVSQGISNTTSLDVNATNAGGVSGTNATVTVNIAQSWSTTGAPALIKGNVTSNSGPAAAGARLLDLQVAGASKFSVDLGGIVGFTGTSAAAAQIATMTNGPTAGNPAFWLPVTINGTTRNIPCW